MIDNDDFFKSFNIMQNNKMLDLYTKINHINENHLFLEIED